MQIILTQEEYDSLKYQSEKSRETYVKRIDVALALEEMVKELASVGHAFDPITFQRIAPDWKRIIAQFHERIK